MPLDIFIKKGTNEPTPTDPSDIACHSVVLAQSGSGKSFMVGRLVEELLLKTKARIVILDPNSDFVRLTDVDDSTWANSALTQWLYPGDDLDAFSGRWSAVPITVLSNRNLPNAAQLRVDWGALTDNERAHAMGIDPTRDPDLYWAAVLAGEVARERWDDSAEPFFDFSHFRVAAEEVCDFLSQGAAAPDISENLMAQGLRPLGIRLALRLRSILQILESFDIWRDLGDGSTDISEYFSSSRKRPAATIVDLLSLASNSERLAITSRVIASIWNSAREDYNAALRDVDEQDKRVPTFLVLDEAHNLAPGDRKSPEVDAVTREIVRIAAEGRKFGLFLVLVTQRPRRLHPNVLSECDVLLTMRMTNTSDLKYATESVGTGSLAVSRSELLSLTVGDILLQGRVGDGSTIHHVAPRRTRQGGHGIDDSYWTASFPLQGGPR